jgi:hypothetical protein
MAAAALLSSMFRQLTYYLKPWRPGPRLLRSLSNRWVGTLSSRPTLDTRCTVQHPVLPFSGRGLNTSLNPRKTPKG